ncbi:MAG: hypothetical protein ACOYL6_12145 [Bacteriovoracaceae bacterium]
MKSLVLLFLCLTLFACSSQQTTDSVNRDVASTQFDVTAFKNLLDKTKATFPKLGNPRYYVFDHFSQRARTLLSGSDQNAVQLVASYKVLAEAGIYLNFSRVIDPDSKEVAANLGQLEKTIGALNDKVSAKIFPEVMEKALTEERLLMVKSLTQRISRHYQTFVKNSADKTAVKALVKGVLGLKSAGVASEYKAMKLDKNYLRAKKILSNLSLPEVGDIDGSDDAFEKVMSVQISMEMVNWLVDRELRN